MSSIPAYARQFGILAGSESDSKCDLTLGRFLQRKTQQSLDMMVPVCSCSATFAKRLLQR